MGDIGGLVVSGLLGLLVLAAAVVFIGRSIGQRMQRRQGGPRTGPMRYKLDPDVGLDGELYDRVRELMHDDERSEAVTALRTSTRGLGREDAEAIVDGIASGAISRPEAGGAPQPGRSKRSGTAQEQPGPNGTAGTGAAAEAAGGPDADETGDANNPDAANDPNRRGDADGGEPGRPEGA